MKTTDLSILKQFYTVLNRNVLTQEIYDKLIKEWGFEGLDLEAEQIKINQKCSNLSKSKRDAVPEFLILKRILNDRKNIESQSISMANEINQDFANDQITL